MVFDLRPDGGYTGKLLLNLLDLRTKQDAIFVSLDQCFNVHIRGYYVCGEDYILNRMDILNHCCIFFLYVPCFLYYCVVLINYYIFVCA